MDVKRIGINEVKSGMLVAYDVLNDSGQLLFPAGARLTEKAITRIEKADGSWEYVSDPDKCIGCGICAGVCPCGVWSIADNPEPIKMYSTGAKM